MNKKIDDSGYGIALEEYLRHQIYTALQGDVVDDILRIAKIRKNENYWRNVLEGHSFKVEKQISSKLYALFHEVKNELGFGDSVDFYISGNANVNAFALSGVEENEPHIININSSLIQLMTDDELRFVIGHEMGHLINKNTELMRLINFIFPEPENAPTLLGNKIRLWNQLSELIADRYGFMAMPDIDVCISAFFKMSSGLDSGRVDLHVEAFIEENNKRLEYFKNSTGLNYASHPINPIRVKALELFSQSEKCNPGKKGALTNEEIETNMDELIDILLKLRSSEIDVHLTYFIASAGLIIAGCDKDIADKEIDFIIQNLAEFRIFPKSFLEGIAKSGEAMSVFQQSIELILKINPAERERMLQYMIEIVMADNELKNVEVKTIFEIGAKMLGYSVTEVAQIFAGIIQHRFVPSYQSLA
ncbi:MAG TPA: M48 family metallopeptidase [Bacteroidales bacterium]|nr:M48 family metallopeptidase [Bacteroidales bacterium]